MKRWMVTIVFMSILASIAGAATETNTLHIVGAEPRAATAVSIRRKADYVAVPVHVMNDEKVKGDDKQIYFQRQTATALMAAVTKSKAPLVVKFTGLEKQPYLYIMTPVEEDSKDMAYYLRKVKTLFQPVFFTGKSKCMLGSPTLAVRDPEQYRNPIIKKIIYSVESLSKTLDSAVRIELSGLEQPVVVESIDDEYVDLYIPYKLSVEIERGK